MPKGGKSSASSATRKKHARRAAPDEIPLPLPQKKPKTKKGEKPPPKVKQYTPPSRPAPVQIDPLDSLGLASQLDKDLVVSLRHLGKKDPITRAKAIDDLNAWVGREDPSESLGIVPVWLHHFPSLVMHPSRRLRLTSASLHNRLLDVPVLRESIVFNIREVASVYPLAAWCLSSFDVDRAVGREASRSWSQVVEWKRSSENEQQPLSTIALEDDDLSSMLSEILIQALVDPSAVCNSIFLPSPQALSSQKHVPRRDSRAQGNEGEDTSRKSEGEEENEGDRNARLRAGSLGALRWLISSYSSISGRVEFIPSVLERVVDQPHLFTVLSQVPIQPEIYGVALGYNQPLVRRGAWSLLSTMIPCLDEDYLAHKFPYISRCVLFSAWAEPDPTVRNVMWEPLLTYLTSVKDAWLHAAHLSSFGRTLGDNSVGGDENEDSPSDSESQVDGDPGAVPLNDRGYVTQHLVYDNFLRFLELGCGGSPSQGYPTLVVILSTIPNEILPCTEGALRQLFASIWAAFDNKALSTSLEKGRRETTAAFVTAVSECIGVYARKLYLGTPECTLSSDERISLGLSLTREQWSRLWSEALEGRFGLPSRTLGTILGRSLLRLRAIASDLFAAAWALATSVSLDSPTVKTEPVLILAAVSSQLESPVNAEAGNLQSVVTALVTKWFLEIINSPTLSAGTLSEGALDELLVKLEALIIHFDHRIIDDLEITKGISSILESNIAELVRNASPRILTSLITTYLKSRPSEQQATWVAVLHALAPLIHDDNIARKAASKQLLSSLAQSEQLPNVLVAPDHFSNSVLFLLDNILQEHANAESDAEFLHLLLSRPSAFINQAAFDAIYAKVNSHLTQMAHSLLQKDSLDPTISLALLLLEPMLSAAKDEVRCSFLTSIFLAAHAKWEDPSALRIWNAWRKVASPGVKACVRSDITNLLRTAMSDVDSKMRPTDLLELAFKASDLGGQGWTTLEILPTQNQFGNEIQSLNTYMPHPSLTIIDPLIPPSALGVCLDVHPVPKFDFQGHSSFARTRIGLVEAVASDRRLIRENGWIITQLVALDVFARDFEALPSCPNPFFTRVEEWKSFPKEIITKTQQTLAYALSSLVSSIPVDWHKNVTTIVKEQGSGQSSLGLGPLADVLVHAHRESVSDNSVLGTRILHNILHALLKEVSTDEADLWLTVAQTHLDSSPLAASAIVRAVAQTNLQSRRLDRIRNELASRLSTVRSSKANSEGLRLLRILNASAPPPDSDVAFLPQQRTIFMFQAIQKWVQEGDELDEEIESQLAELFFNVAPIVQSIPGAHWDFIVDVIESNLDNASLTLADSLPMLWRTLKLVGEIEELVNSNKVLRETWSERRGSVYAPVKKSLAVIIPPDEVSRPRDICRGLIVGLAAASPETLVDGDSLSTLSHLLVDPSLEVQITAHELLHHASKPYTENVVLEAELSTDTNVKPALPNELMRIIEENEVESDKSVLSHLLAWMIVFDLFTDASPRVKSSYIDGLRTSGVVEDHLLPAIFNSLNIGAGGKPFSLDVWAVDDFVVSLLDEESSRSNQILAAHVYYRALVVIPSLIRGWWSNCKDRQLSGAVASYTSGNFSPSIISRLLAGVRRTNIMESLQGENFTVKLQPAISEIIAGYLVDEQQMEIALRIPWDYPLHAIEIKDICRIGVQETKWRMWLLNVNQIAQTGQIVDALFWFKRNISSFFEGKVECAICYSVISVMDRSLPNKPCKTCKNRFHASCLYKWFNTSHSSSCPLCRSNII